MKSTNDIGILRVECSKLEKRNAELLNTLKVIYHTLSHLDSIKNGSKDNIDFAKMLTLEAIKKAEE